MPLDIVWTRRALTLPPEVLGELSGRLEGLSRHFPEMKREIKIGITRVYDGLAFQSEDGKAMLMLDVRRRRDGGWKYPTYWTMAHELMHLAQFNSKGIPGGERATDVHALARLPPRLIDDSPSYLVVPRGLRGRWGTEAAHMAHTLAREAIALRANGLRRYASWWESEFERRWRPAHV
jgi:hypothetical protein